MRIIILFIIIIFSIQSTIAQIQTQLIENNFFQPSDSQSFSIHVSNTNFFKNNEYFNPLNEGYTLLGFGLAPSLAYRPSATTRIEAGAHFLKYAGDSGFYHIQPLFRFQYQPSDWFQLVAGSIFGGQNHQLIEPMYQWERSITHPVENGLQFLVQSNRVKADVWLEWERFILNQSPFQEELLFGTSLSWKLLPNERFFDIYIPFQTTVQHRGGQKPNTSVDLPLLTVANYATAFQTDCNINKRFIKKISASLWYLGYHDLSPQKLQNFNSGSAIYPKLNIELSNFNIESGYYIGNQLMGTKGNPLFYASLLPSTTDSYKHKQLLTLQFSYNKIISKGISLTVYIESYNELIHNLYDYNYGLHLIFDREFFITHLK